MTKPDSLQTTTVGHARTGGRETKKLHSLLVQEVERQFGSVERVPEDLSAFLEHLSDTCRGLDEDRRMLELSLTLRSQELAHLREDLVTHAGLQATLRERTEELARARAEAEHAERAKLAFLDDMSHELRTPLSAVIGFAELIQERVPGDLTSKQEQYIRIIVESGRRLLALIDTILDLAKADSAPSTLNRTPVAIADLLETGLLLFNEKCLKHGIHQSLDVRDEARGLKVTLDERRIRRVLFELLANAVRVTPDGGRISVELALLTETSGAVPCGLRQGVRLPAAQVSVLYTGIGIAPNHLGGVFDPCCQVDGGATDTASGAGRGLALVRQIVELHGGRVWAESTSEGRGSTLRFIVPLEPEPAETEAPGDREGSQQ